MAEWISFNRSYKEFASLGRHIPGVVMEVQMNGFENCRKVFLVGDVNVSGSHIGDNLFDDNDIVIRYKYIWGHWEPSKQSN